MAGPMIVRGSAPPPDVVSWLPEGTTDFFLRETAILNSLRRAGKAAGWR